MLANYVKKQCYVAILVVLVLVLAACHSSQHGPSHDVSYFKAHADERKAVIKRCANDPGTYAVESNCTNAFEADKQAMYTAPNSLQTPPDSLATKGFVPPTKNEKKDSSH